MTYTGNFGANQFITTDTDGYLQPTAKGSSNELLAADGYVLTLGPGLSITGGSIDTFLPINPQSSSYTLQLSDKGTMVIITSVSPTTLTVPADSSVDFPIGTQVLVVRGGSGAMAVAGDMGVTVNSAQSYLNLNYQNSAATLVKTAADTWYLFGDLKA